MGDAQRIDQAEIRACIVLGCDQRARYTFVADGYGILAGREWRPGDMIDLCPNHAHDVYLGVDPTDG